MKRPISTIVFVDGIYRPKRGRWWLIRTACGHEAAVGGRGKEKPRIGDAHPCASCANLRSVRADRELRRMATQDFTLAEIDYIAGRLYEAEQRRRQS